MKPGTNKESWLPTPGFPKYEVSDQGRVRNRKTGRILSSSLQNNILYTGLIRERGGAPNAVAVRKLVATAFVANPQNAYYVEPINGNQSDCRAKNLRWKTHDSVEGEEWRAIIGFPDYDVSNLGRVRVAKTKQPISLQLEGGCLHALVLYPCAERRLTEIRIHCAVAEAWHLPNPAGSRYLKHIDGNRTNNRVENLRWEGADTHLPDESEQWRPVASFGNKYEISNLGRVRNTDTQAVLTRRMSRGMPQVRLLRDGSAERETWAVRKLVALTWIPNSVNSRFISHKDGNLLNCRVDNLRWGKTSVHTHSEDDKEWRPVVGMEKDYEVSDRGTIRRRTHAVKAPAGKILKQQIANGYPHVIMCSNGSPNPDYVHRVVAKAFVPNPKGWRYVRHLDGDPLNNHYTNLRWAKSPKVNPNPPPIRRRDGEAYWECESPTGDVYLVGNLRAFCARIQIPCGGMQAVARGTSKHCKGWKCRRVEGTKKTRKESLAVVEGRPYYRIFTPEGNTVNVGNLALFCRKKRLDYGVILRIVSGLRKIRWQGWSCQKINPIDTGQREPS